MITAGESAFVIQLEQSGTAGQHPACAAWAAARAARRGPGRPASRRGSDLDWLCTLCQKAAAVPHDPSRLPDREADRRRWDGRGLPRPAALDQPPGRHQDDGPHQRRQRQGQGLLPARDDGAQGPADAERLCHPNIVAFYDIFEIEGQFQLVMEYVAGKNALDCVEDLSHPLSIPTAARIGRQLLVGARLRPLQAATSTAT